MRMGSNAARIGTALVTGGLSEAVRAGQAASKGDVTGALTSSFGAYGAGAGATAAKILKPGVLQPPTPATALPSEDQAAVKAALDKADLERRKGAQTATNFTSALGLPGDAKVKRSVLG